MKKARNYLIVSLVLSVLTACYKDDYIKDFEINSVYFPYQTNVRTLVVGEGMKIQIGANLGGVRTNTKDRNVGFTLDNNLLTPSILNAMKTSSFTHIKEPVNGVTQLLPLPTSYYTLSDNSKMVIKAGQHMGAVTLLVDSVKFLSDAATLKSNYALPFYIQTADADTILEAKRTAVIGIKYENMLFGNYWHGGVTTIKDASGNTISTIKYYTTIPSPETKVWKLTTVGPHTLVTNGYSDVTTSKGEMRLTLDGSNITVSPNAGAKYSVTSDGASTFNRAKLLQNRKIVLSYKYQNADGNTCYAQDTLTFRNRIRDGVNEWQDENPANY